MLHAAVWSLLQQCTRSTKKCSWICFNPNRYDLVDCWKSSCFVQSSFLDPWLKKKILEVVQNSYNIKTLSTPSNVSSPATTPSLPSFNGSSFWGPYTSVSSVTSALLVAMVTILCSTLVFILNFSKLVTLNHLCSLLAARTWFPAWRHRPRQHWQTASGIKWSYLKIILLLALFKRLVYMSKLSVDGIFQLFGYKNMLWIY